MQKMFKLVHKTANVPTATTAAAAAVVAVVIIAEFQDAFKLAVFGSVEGAPEKQKSSGGTKRKTDDPEAKVGGGGNALNSACKRGVILQWKIAFALLDKPWVY